MTTTKFILLATSAIAGAAAFYLTRGRKSSAPEQIGPFPKKERHYSPVFANFKKQGHIGD